MGRHGGSQHGGVLGLLRERPGIVALQVLHHIVVRRRQHDRREPGKIIWGCGEWVGNGIENGCRRWRCRCGTWCCGVRRDQLLLRCW